LPDKNKNKFKRKGTPPAPTTESIEENEAVRQATGYPMLSFRHVRSGYCVEELTEKQRSDFLLKWFRRAKFTWAALGQHDKHALGYEFMPKKQIKPQLPEHLQQDKYMVFRHHQNLPVLGFKAGDTFYVLWIENEYGQVYDH
jgi:hypothetical protein